MLIIKVLSRTDSSVTITAYMGIFLSPITLVAALFYWQWPTLDCVTIGLLVIFIRPIFSVVETDIVNTGETKENLFALFILLYCVSLYQRLREVEGAAGQAAPAPSET